MNDYFQLSLVFAVEERSVVLSISRKKPLVFNAHGLVHGQSSDEQGTKNFTKDSDELNAT